MKVFPGTVKLNGRPAVAAWSGTGFATVGAVLVWGGALPDTSIVTQSAALASLPSALSAPGTGVTTSLKCRVAVEAGAVNSGVAVVAPVSVTPPVTAVFELAPSTWVHCQVTLSPHAPVARPASVTVAPVAADRSAPAFATGLNGAPVLPCNLQTPSDAVSGSKTLSGSEARLLPCRYRIRQRRKPVEDTVGQRRQAVAGPGTAPSTP